MATKQAAILVLADGTCYNGYAFGASGTAIGEVVFNTGMTGYQEVITDPSYRGQIVTFTCPELGNTGVNPEDEESDRPQVRGVIARNITVLPSNWRSRQTLPDYLKAHNVVGISGIDTRALTRKLRSLGAMNGGISTEILDPQALLAKVNAAPSMQGLNLAQEASTDRIYEWTEKTLTEWEFVEPAHLSGDTLTVVAIDFGVKKNILRRLASYGCRVIVVPANTPAETILAYNPDGIFLSNGPGDPAAVTEGIATAKVLLEANKPMFGICLGHQILGLSMGGDTFKLKFGHRGLNQPAQNQAENADRRVEITSQNHGFALTGESFETSPAMLTHINLNDRTVAGLEHKTLPIFSVQYHPEASPGPHDADYLFERFVMAMREHKKAVA
ncbi:glutamine-hydrolyzing carbamoyl-phosphate synthase small subunit [Pseudanabaena sp. FACHB-1277]|jgi:carbamoyl-phosphate synthase small subunit|uniref:Carbamoyl phosphate synthase small chain n=1 Tax=Pseudanabaena cinerea FACHB-1277 TaxID=2949581 RepID=A0A926UTV5_9CYAN|nr:glutamine-hydrolyzing carbamoyl-phosphate synthase small subunit [Pseudanabaena cinerea]MBD2151260.1 glutamine-hydrolyzing carbamoyl-phosphate synthase small subunit [Pseudanabaena cinerea FACHB-1277]